LPPPYHTAIGKNVSGAAGGGVAARPDHQPVVTSTATVERPTARWRKRVIRNPERDRHERVDTGVAQRV
jgi:hypothetical protein